VGSLADIESFSFHVGKIFTCGEGGALTLNDSKMAKWLRMVRGHGMDPERRFFHPTTAYNYRLTNLQASLLCAQLERRDEILERRRHVFQRYEKNLQGTPGLGFQQVADWAVTCPWVFCITIDSSAFGLTRDQLIDTLAEQGIESRRFGIPLHTLPPFREQSRHRGDHCPIAEQFSETGLYLPSSTDLTDEQVDTVCEIVRSSAKRMQRKCA
jgi:perosamine synthetase